MQAGLGETHSGCGAGCHYSKLRYGTFSSSKVSTSKAIAYSVETYQDDPYMSHIDNPSALVHHIGHYQYDLSKEGHQMGQVSLKSVSTRTTFVPFEPYLTGGRDTLDPMSFQHQPQMRSLSLG